MPAIRLFVTATTADALSNEKFRVQNRMAAVSIYASCLTEGDSLGFSVGAQEFLVSGSRVNVESSTGVIDTDRDLVLLEEIVPPGQYFLPVTLTTNMDILLIIEPL